MKSKLAVLLALLGSVGAPSLAASEPVREGWLDWRGPLQAGVSLETGLIDSVEVDGKNHLWNFVIRGRGTPVMANGRVFFMGYSGEGPDLQEAFVCLDEKTGAELWRVAFSDFLSDTVYDRYSISSPTIDPQTGNLIILTTPGLLCSFTPDGELRWQRSLLADFGRITFPNSRTGAVVFDDDLAILHTVTANWGPDTPARDRFYAFDKDTGELVWSSTPGEVPKDSPYSHPVLAWKDGKRVLYSGTGCGNVVCVNARNGELEWRFKLATGGINSSVVLHGDTVIAVHQRENVDSTVIGRMVALDGFSASDEGPGMYGPGDEKWRAEDVAAFTSSPVLVGDRIYQTVQTCQPLLRDPTNSICLQ